MVELLLGGLAFIGLLALTVVLLPRGAGLLGVGFSAARGWLMSGLPRLVRPFAGRRVRLGL